MRAMRFYLDIEFLKRGPHVPIELISLAMVTDDDQMLYLVNADFDRALADDWMRTHVLPHLDRDDAHAPVPFGQFGPADRSVRRAGLRRQQAAVREVARRLRLRLLSTCFGRMIDHPAGWPKHFLDLREWAGRLGNAHIPRTQPHEHDALYDARHDRDAFRALAELEASRAARSERRLRERLFADVTQVLRPAVLL